VELPHLWNTIQHDLDEAHPRVGLRDPCHVCRRALVMDPATIKLVEPPDEAFFTNQTRSVQT
jgi:hypothetical protein